MITNAIGPAVSLAAQVKAHAMPAGGGALPSSSQSFLGSMQQVADEAMRSVRESESTAAGGLVGKAPLQQVVDTMLKAERNLQTAIAVRDKLVSAYQEISRMPI